MPGVSDVLLIDNVDSFTYNVADLLHRVLGRPPVIWRHDHDAGPEDLAAFSAIVVGPGPGRPQVDRDLGLSRLALEQDAVPVLGVCLGHQGMAHLRGVQVAEMRVPRHGIVSPVEHDGTGLFKGVPSPLQVVRYHSLEVVEPTGGSLRITARATDDGCVMAMADPQARWWSVQFHPESVLSEHGEQIVGNFLQLAGVGVATETEAGAVAVGDTLVPHTPQPGGRTVRLEVRRFSGAAPVDPWALREALVGAAPSSVWLDASDRSGFSLIADGSGPLSFELTHRVDQGEVPLLDRLDAELDRWLLEEDGSPALPFDWRPGFVGYWGYELKAETGGSAGHTSRWPDAWLIFADRGVVLDHASGDVFAVWLAIGEPDVDAAQHAWAAEVEQAVDAAAEDTYVVTRGVRAGPPAAVQIQARHTRAEYVDLVRRCQREIARGESYEICLTTAYRVPTGPGEAELYRAMREVSPVPHGAWLRTPQLSVLGCSPERFVRVDAGGQVEARPIKGTRPRSTDPEQDLALARDLSRAQKDRAENLMIVDLLRNDLHRVCRSASVHVPEIFAVESYATVHQLVSTVRGALATGMGPTDVLRACFPGGSMTGAPKVRTMELLDAIEGAARGVYSGAIGWIGLNGAMDTSIVIRTATWCDGTVEFGVGGAVTALSDPELEYQETVDKAQSVLRAIEVAQSG